MTLDARQTNSFVNFMPEGFGDSLFPWILLPVILGEGALALWLLIAGVRSSTWNEIAAARAGMTAAARG